jgi:N-succinyldiaminopimelate aminotransferase
VDPATQVLPVNGSREALFAFAQTVIDPPGASPWWCAPIRSTRSTKARPCWPGAEPYYAPSDPARNFAVDWDSVPDAVSGQRTQLLFVCSPGNPTGAVMPLDEWEKLFELSDRHGFVIASDECYSEIYFRDEPGRWGLEAAGETGPHDFRNLMWPSPACPSAATCRDAQRLRGRRRRPDQGFLLYRTYHGSAMSPVVQAASIAAWNDESTSWTTARMYREKFAQVTPMLAQVLDVRCPTPAFTCGRRTRSAWQGTTPEFARTAG